MEAAEAHAGHLEDGESALKKRNSELGTALAQRKAAVRQLEDRLRALQVRRGQEADGCRGKPWALPTPQLLGKLHPGSDLQRDVAAK